MDLCLSAMGLAVLLVPFALIAAVVYLDDPGPVFFSKYRIGRQIKLFKLYKFRAMKQDTSKYLSTQEMVDLDDYITSVDMFSEVPPMDELTQMINAVYGDMQIMSSRSGSRSWKSKEATRYGFRNEAVI